jgi:hypothetical protein
MPAVLTYSPSDVTIFISDYQLTGLMSVELQWTGTPFVFRRGIRGVHTRTYSNDISATLRLEVQQTSITNDVLFQILEQDRLNKSARLDVTIKDTGGSTMLQSDQGYIPRYPQIKFSHGFESRVWTIDLLTITDGFTIGGNNHAGFDIFSSVQGAIDLLGGAATNASDFIDNLL